MKLKSGVNTQLQQKQVWPKPLGAKVQIEKMAGHLNRLEPLGAEDERAEQPAIFLARLINIMLKIRKFSTYEIYLNKYNNED